MNEDAFYAALHENPSDELTWLALADWLDDNDQPSRAELVRLSRTLRTAPVMPPDAAHIDPEMRIIALLASGIKPVVAQLSNSVGMRFSLIEPGVFLMGSPDDEDGRQSDETIHEVCLSRAFYMGVYPVTQAQWRTMMGDNPSWFSKGGGGNLLVEGFANTDDFPVDSVSWTLCQEFLDRLNLVTSERRLGRRYRLPTEAEWEYACRAGISHTPYHFGATLTAALACWEANHFNRTCPVGQYVPNAYGLFDMHGNIWEWCQDWYGRYDPNSVTDPVGPADGDERISRGGAFFNTPEYCRAAHRGAALVTSEENYDGFRIVLEWTPT